MSSSEPNPLFLESLPQLSLPPPSDGDTAENDSRLFKLSSSLREHTSSVGTAFKHHTSATSCPGVFSAEEDWLKHHEQQQRVRRAEKNNMSISPTGSSSHAEEDSGGSTSKHQSLSSIRGGSLTALSILVSKSLGAFSHSTGGGGSLPAFHTAHNSINGICCGDTAVSEDGSGDGSGMVKVHNGQCQLQQQHIGSYVFSAVTRSTADTTSSSISSKDGLEEGDEEAASTTSSTASSASGEEPGCSADAAMGPFLLEELEELEPL